MNMQRDLDSVELQQLEKLIDRVGIQSVLMGISEICGLKGDHIEENWQDKPLAKRWNTLCGAVGVIVPKAHGL
jgi:hypothetical protein